MAAGLGERIVRFYEGLRDDNTRGYWLAHKDVYDRDVAAPMHALADALEPEFGKAKVFRPYRDVRFSTDKTPYKEHVAMAVGSAGVGALYLQTSADDLMVAGGWYQPDPAQLQAFRQAVDDEKTEADLDRTLASLARAGFPLDEGDPVKTVPRGWSRDHRRIDLLRRRSLTVQRHHDPSAVEEFDDLLALVATEWRQVRRWNDWLAQHARVRTGGR